MYHIEKPSAAEVSYEKFVIASGMEIGDAKALFLRNRRGTTILDTDLITSILGPRFRARPSRSAHPAPTR